MSFAGAGCGCNVDINVRCGAHAYAGAYPGVGGRPPIIFLPTGGPGIFQGPGLVQHGHRGGGNIIINNGPTAAGGHILQGAGVGGFGVGYPNYQSGLGGYGILDGQIVYYTFAGAST